MTFDYSRVPETKLTGPDGAACSTRQGLKHGYLCAEYVIRKGLPGVIVECGVAAGAQVAMMARAVKDQHGTRTFHLFDSFEGIPMAGPKDADQPGIGAPQHDVHAPIAERLVSSGISASTVDRVKANLHDWDCKGPFVYHKGWFQHTLPHLQNFPPIALLRLDGDLYESTAVCLRYLYPLVVEGGLIVIDDYALPGCKKAVHEYLADYCPAVRIVDVEDVGGGAHIATWIK